MKLQDIESALNRLGATSVAVRSSAVEEDGIAASFAGVYLTRLNIASPSDVADALVEIRNSASSPAAAAYRRKRGLSGRPRMAAIVQTFLSPDASGVLFMKDPIDGARRIVVEGAWGLGEAVVSGRVTPDRWVLSQQGDVISSTIATKDIAIVPHKIGIREVGLDPLRRTLPCLSSSALRELCKLAACCGNLFGVPQDIEWASASGAMWLLQSRPITAFASHGELTNARRPPR